MNNKRFQVFFVEEFYTFRSGFDSENQAKNFISTLLKDNGRKFNCLIDLETEAILDGNTNYFEKFTLEQSLEFSLPG